MARRGVVIEFDFAALNGAELLFDTARRFLQGLDGIALDERIEAKYLAGASYQDGLGRLFSVVKTKKTAQKAARDLAAAFSAAVTAAVPTAVGAAFKNFVKALTDTGVKVILLTRADLTAVESVFMAAFGSQVILHQETSDGYGMARCDSWRRACRAGGLSPLAAVAVTGSGFGVKSALIAGMASVGVVNDHVAYQDFGGADDVLNELSGKTAKRLLGRLGH